MKMRWFIILSFIMLGSGSVFARKSKTKEKIIYKYKKFEKFNLEEISVDGETGVPGDISIINRFKREFNNRLPYRKNFRPEVILSIERIQ
jgi:hypothetical protein